MSRPEFSRSNYYYWLTTEKDGLETKLFYRDFDNKRLENYYLKDDKNYVAVTIKFKYLTTHDGLSGSGNMITKLRARVRDIVK